jgi:hypothetical protein
VGAWVGVLVGDLVGAFVGFFVGVGLVLVLVLVVDKCLLAGKLEKVWAPKQMAHQMVPWMDLQMADHWKGQMMDSMMAE